MIRSISFAPALKFVKGEPDYLRFPPLASIKFQSFCNNLYLLMFSELFHEQFLRHISKKANKHSLALNSLTSYICAAFNWVLRVTKKNLYNLDLLYLDIS